MEIREIAYRHLNKFTGKWRTQGQVLRTNTSAGLETHGIDTYEWLPGDFFLLHKVDVKIGDERMQTLEIIGFDEVANHYTMQHYDNKGNSGLMTATLTDDVWVFKGESMLFRGGFSEDDTVLSGVWKRLNPEKLWIPFMTIKLVKES